MSTQVRIPTQRYFNYAPAKVQTYFTKRTKSREKLYSDTEGRAGRARIEQFAVTTRRHELLTRFNSIPGLIG